MPFFQVFSIGARVLAMVTCSALALLVFFQLHRDRVGRLFACMALDMTLMSFLGLLSRFAGALNYGGEAVRRFYSLGSIFTAALPFLVFVFTIEFLGAWTRWRGWIAALLLLFGLITSLYMLADAAFIEFHMSVEGYFIYRVVPMINVAIGVGDLGVLFAVQAVLEQSRKKIQGEGHRSLLIGLILLCFGFLLIILPTINRYVFHLEVWTASFVIMAVPVFRQRLFDPLSQLNRKLAHRAEQLSIITRVGQQATSFLKLDALLDMITGEIQRAFGYYAVTMFLSDNSSQTVIVAKAAAGLSARKSLETAVQQPLDSTSLAGAAAATRQVVNVGDVGQDKRHAPHALRPVTRAEIALPLLVGSAASEETLIGVLDIQSERADAFEAEEVKVLQILANQIAIAVRNAELFEEAQSARQKADEASRQKTAFLAQMNHELRTPLQTVLSRCQWMLQHPEAYGGVALPNAYLTDMRSIEASGKHLQSLISDILDLSKIEAGESQMRMAPVDPLAVLRNVQETYVGSLLPGVQIVALHADSLPYLWGDKVKITQILGNLVGNACKFTQRGSITLSAEVQDGKLRFSVADTGTGISPDVQTVLFKPYTPANREVVHRHGGTGLGLYVCKQLVDLHGGDIWFESPPGQGATFYFTLPLASADQIPCESAAQPPSSRVVVFARRPKRLPAQVLFVDVSPEKRVREQVGSFLTQVGYGVVTVEMGLQATSLTELIDPAAVVIVIRPDHAVEVQKLVQQLHENEKPGGVRVVEVQVQAFEAPTWQTDLSGQLPPSVSYPDTAENGPSRTGQQGLPSARAARGNGGKGLPGRVLVVDLHPDTRQQMEKTLSQIGCTVLLAETASQVVVRGSFADLRAVVVVVHPDNVLEMQGLVRILRHDVMLANTRIVECQASADDWQASVRQQLSTVLVGLQP